MELSSCRICLQSDNIKLQSLFQVNNDKSYAVMVNFSAGVEVILLFHYIFSNYKVIIIVCYYSF